MVQMGRQALHLDAVQPDLAAVHQLGGGRRTGQLELGDRVVDVVGEHGGLDARAVGPRGLQPDLGVAMQLGIEIRVGEHDAPVEHLGGRALVDGRPAVAQREVAVGADALVQVARVADGAAHEQLVEAVVETVILDVPPVQANARVEVPALAVHLVLEQRGDEDLLRLVHAGDGLALVDLGVGDGRGAAGLGPARGDAAGRVHGHAEQGLGALEVRVGNAQLGPGLVAAPQVERALQVVVEARDVVLAADAGVDVGDGAVLVLEERVERQRHLVAVEEPAHVEAAQREAQEHPLERRVGKRRPRGQRAVDVVGLDVLRRDADAALRRQEVVQRDVGRDLVVVAGLERAGGRFAVAARGVGDTGKRRDAAFARIDLDTVAPRAGRRVVGAAEAPVAGERAVLARTTRHDVDHAARRVDGAQVGARTVEDLDAFRGLGVPQAQGGALAAERLGARPHAVRQHLHAVAAQAADDRHLQEGVAAVADEDVGVARRQEPDVVGPPRAQLFALDHVHPLGDALHRATRAVERRNALVVTQGQVAQLGERRGTRKRQRRALVGVEVVEVPARQARARRRRLGRTRTDAGLDRRLDISQRRVLDHHDVAFPLGHRGQVATRRRRGEVVRRGDGRCRGRRGLRGRGRGRCGSRRQHRRRADVDVVSPCLGRCGQKHEGEHGHDATTSRCAKAQGTHSTSSPSSAEALPRAWCSPMVIGGRSGGLGRPGERSESATCGGA